MTPMQNACLIAIRELTVDGVSPSYDELRRRLNLASKSGVHRLVHALADQGYLRLRMDRYRQYEIIERGGGAISDARIGAMSDEALESALTRIQAALDHRRALATVMLEAAA